MTPLVSITVSSYKHAKYLPTCLDSLLNQNVNFDYEVVVGEDCSNDGSKEILEDYMARYPERLVVLFNEQNLGVSKNGTNIMSHCRGKYIASCESDDFWCDPNKLQKQVDYLEAHPEIAAVGANGYFVNDHGEDRKLMLQKKQTDRVYHLKDFLRDGFLIHGNTLMRRRETTPIEEERYRQLRLTFPTQGDVITRCCIYAKGGIYVFPEPMLCHRDGRAVSSSFTAQNQNKAIYYTEMHRDILRAVEEYLGGKYDLMPKLCHRMGYILMAKAFRLLQFSMKEYCRLFRQLSPRLKLLTLWQFIRLSFKKVGGAIYWRFHKRNRYQH